MEQLKKRVKMLIIAILVRGIGMSFLNPNSNAQSDQPSWLGSNAGISDKVPPPWRPLVVKGNKVESWGRTYEFSNIPFPSKIISQEESLLSSPIGLRLEVDDGTINFRDSKITIKGKSDSSVCLQSDTRTASLNVLGETTIEYDGMIRVDLNFIPQKEVTVNELVLEIPIKKEYAKLYHIYPNGSVTAGEERGKFTSSGSLPPDGLAYSFKSYIWLGNQKVGVGWFTESDKGWNSRKNDRIQVIPQDDKVILTLYIIDRPTKIDKPLTYTFGLQASPVKPIASDFHEKVHLGPVYTPPKEIPLFAGNLNISYPPYGNIRANQGTLEMWVGVGFNPAQPPDRDIFMLSLPAGQRALLRWSAVKGLVFYVRNMDKDSFSVAAPTYWKRDEIHHLALTWGDKISIYIDGQLFVEKPFTGLVGELINENSLANFTLLQFGANLWFATGFSGFIFDEIKISSIPKTSFELSKFKTDEDTLLLDHLDENFIPDEDTETKAAKISKEIGGLGGLPGAGTKFVTTKFGKGLSTVVESIPDRTVLDYWKELGVNAVIAWSSWTEIHNTPGTSDPQRKENLKNFVAESHKRGIKVILYVGENTISTISPYLKEWGDRISCQPKSGWNLYPGEDVINTCYNSPWQDFMAEGIKRLMDEYDIDGVYLDGTNQPLQCTNELHGCGYRGRFDKLETTYPIFAVRNTMKRFYQIVKAKKEDGLVIGHTGISLTLPTISFLDINMSGENFGLFPDLVANDPLSACPLGTFQAHYFGKNLGIPNEMATYNYPPLWTPPGVLSYSLVHDTLTYNPPELKSKVWKVFSEFEISKARWYPYWDNANFIKVSPDSIKVSFYKKEGAVLFVISNLGKTEEKAEIKLNLSKLGVKGQTIYDAITKEKIKLDSSTLSIPLRPFRMKMVIVE